MPRKGNLNWYNPMPADYGDKPKEEEVKALVGTPVAPEPITEPDPEIEIELAGAPKKRGRPAKKTAQKAEDEQGTTAKD